MAEAVYNSLRLFYIFVSNFFAFSVDNIVKKVYNKRIVAIGYKE